MLFGAEGVELLVFLMHFTTFLLYTVINNFYFHPSPKNVMNSGYAECPSTFDEQDLLFCKQFSTVKPAPAGIEFLELSDILMCENDWFIPNNCEEALILFLNLVNEIH